jgi:hypothetical protein
MPMTDPPTRRATHGVWLRRGGAAAVVTARFDAAGVFTRVGIGNVVVAGLGDL